MLLWEDDSLEQLHKNRAHQLDTETPNLVLSHRWQSRIPADHCGGESEVSRV